MIFKTTLALLLAMVCKSAAAGWVQIDDNSQFTTYADPSTLRKNGNTVKIWSLTDAKTVFIANGVPYKSTTQYTEYDCNEAQSRDLALNAYADPMARGEVIYTDSKIGNWKPIGPGTIAKFTWELVCANK